MADPFFWYELMTGDTAAAADFYREVVGWSTQAFGAADPGYTVLNVGDRGVAGVMAMQGNYPGGPTWLGYVHAGDVDAAAARLRDAGGTVHREPWDVPGAGRIAAVADPEGAMFMLMTPHGPATPPPAEGSPGTIGWHELLAADGEHAFAFYADQFGWSEAGRYEMGPMGTYRLFASGGEQAAGGMMDRPAGAPRSGWLYYFTVDGLDAAVARVTAAGGEIATPPHEVPGGARIAHCIDPQGARFGLLAPAR